MTAKSWPTSIREINALPETDKRHIYKTLIPDWLFDDFDIDPSSEGAQGQIRYMHPPKSRAMEISVRRKPSDRDPVMYINMADTFNNQLLVLLVVVNDPEASRYDTDVDQHGNPTNFGTTSRNIPAEKVAKAAGLAPGQVRRGLRSFKRAVPVFEEFVTNIGHDMFLIEPLAYHNAIVFEKYGFNYIRGLRAMKDIHQEFQPGGNLHTKLTPDNPFRQPDAWKTVRGRSWAIHDGILGHSFTGFQMYKRVGINAGLNTFPDAQW